MIRTRSVLLAAGVFLVLSPGLQAKSRSGLVSTDFLGKPVGARFVGLGLTGVGVSGTPQSLFYNPAAVQDLTGNAFAVDFQVANQSKLPTDVVLEASSLEGKKLTSLVFAGASRAFFFRPLTSFENYVVTDATDPANNFSQDQARVNQIGICAAQKTEKSYSVGLNLSYLNGQRGVAVADSGAPPVFEMGSGHGVAIDLGFRDQRDYVSYGISAQNLLGVLYWDNFKTDQLPMIVRGGFGFQPAEAFAFYTDYEKRFYPESSEDPDRWHFGMEIAPMSWLAIRGGADSEDFNDRNKTSYAWGFSVATAGRHTLDASTRLSRLNETPVYEYYLSLVWPLSSGSESGSRRR